MHCSRVQIVKASYQTLVTDGSDDSFCQLLSPFVVFCHALLGARAGDGLVTVGSERGHPGRLAGKLVHFWSVLRRKFGRSSFDTAVWPATLNACKGPALHAQFYGALDGFFVVHSVLSRRFIV